MKLCVLTCLVVCVANSVIADLANVSRGVVTILGCVGDVRLSDDGKNWKVIQEGSELSEGTHLRTGPGGTADLMLQYNGSLFRVTGDSELRVESLRRNDTGVEIITETKLHMLRGSLIGSQRKLHRPSVLEIATPSGKAIIRGTEYVVNAQGAVTVLSGSVEVIYNLPGNQGSIKVVVQAGYSFNPATGKVVPTDPSFLQNIIADVTAVRQNAEVFKTGGATIIVKPDDVLSPTTPNGNNGVGNGVDPQPPGNPPINDGPGTGPGNPGNQGGKK